MTAPDGRDRSRAGWSEDRGDPPKSANPLAVAAEARYVDVELAGVGGMGTVMVAEDQRLGRAVAIKRIAVDGDDQRAAARLAREAAITARLEHPGIVPVYDAGLGADGRAYYAMRLIRGRSLAEVLAEAAPLEVRLRLVRAFLAVCQAMAYSHRHGVVHRDLKPANIMIGEFGEVHVVDWGLAEVLAETGDDSDPTAGTPAYLAPERIRGEPATPAGDVWALGAILAEVIVGDRLLPEGRLEILATWADGQPARPVWPERAPAELVAIADKALATSPAARYPDAEPLAADVSAFLDGRRVGAHVYSTAELARRLIAAWRWQLAAIAAAMVAGGLVLGATWTRIAGERRRALTAERRATAALAETRSALGWALDRSAVAALLAGDIAEAELFAAQALSYGESADARGVLAATRAGGRPAATRFDPPPCGRITPDDHDEFLCHDGRTLSLWHEGDAAPRWSVVVQALQVTSQRGGPIYALERSVAISVFDRADGRLLARVPVPLLTDQFVRSPDHDRIAVVSDREAVLLDPDVPGGARTARQCDNQILDAAALSTRALYVICRDGQVWVSADGQDRVVATTPFNAPGRAATAMAVDRDETRLLIGGIDGGLMTIELATGRVLASRRVLDEPVRTISQIGELVAVAGERGGIRLWGAGLDTELVRLPERAGQELAAIDGQLRTGGTSWWSWRLPSAPSPRRYHAPAGLSSAAVSPDGRLVAAARGDGKVSLWTTRLGALRAELPLSDSVVKRVAFSPDGRRLAAVIAGTPEEALIAVDDPTLPVIDRRGHLGSHRVAFLADGTRLNVPYRPTLIRTTPTGERVEIMTGLFADLEIAPAGDTAWLLTRDGEVWSHREQVLERRFAVPNAFSIAPLADGRVVAAAPGLLVIYEPDGRWSRQLTDGPVDIIDVAVSPDGRWIAASASSGTIDVWSVADGRRVAHLRGHAARAPWVGFAAGALWSASWDGAVLRWDLEALEAPADALIADAIAAWGAPPR
jgi:WD40 repeat protein